MIKTNSIHNKWTKYKWIMYGHVLHTCRMVSTFWWQIKSLLTLSSSTYQTVKREESDSLGNIFSLINNEYWCLFTNCFQFPTVFKYNQLVPSTQYRSVTNTKRKVCVLFHASFNIKHDAGTIPYVFNSLLLFLHYHFDFHLPSLSVSVRVSVWRHLTGFKQDTH